MYNSISFAYVWVNIVGEKLGARRACVNNRRVIGFFLFFGRQRNADEVSGVTSSEVTAFLSSEFPRGSRGG